jgi:hypothetical protein
MRSPSSFGNPPKWFNMAETLIAPVTTPMAKVFMAIPPV